MLYLKRLGLKGFHYTASYGDHRGNAWGEKRARDREIVWGRGDEKALSDSGLIEQLRHAFAKDRQGRPGRPAQPLHGRDHAGAVERDRAAGIAVP